VSLRPRTGLGALNLATAMLLAVASTIAAPARAAEPKLPRDGWASWEVAMPEGAPFWCCWSSWDERVASRTPCKLDGHANGYGTRREGDVTDAVRVYAHSTAGKVDRLQALAAACPVETRTPIQDLAEVQRDDSVRWLVAQAKQGGSELDNREPLAEKALAALSLHRGDLARDELSSFARNDKRADTRKWAVFWLSQGGYADAERTINEVLRKDADDQVREHAVFALSQLPGERATKALIATAEDRSVSREQRKRAVFWLSQSETDSAQAYLERVLTAYSQ
jgi:HEAT repeat protein